MTIIDRIFQEVAGISIPHFFITVEFSAMGCEMPERIEAFLWEKYEIILRGANGRKYNPQIQISAESETKRSIFRKRDKTKRSKKESAQHSKSRNKSFVMTSVSAL